MIIFPVFSPTCICVTCRISQHVKLARHVPVNSAATLAALIRQQEASHRHSHIVIPYISTHRQQQLTQQNNHLTQHYSNKKSIHTTPVVPPTNIKFCICSQCAASTSSNPQQPILGKYISSRNFSKHQAKEQKEILQTKANNTHHINIPSSEQSHEPSSESDSTQLSEDSLAFRGFDENEDNFHLIGSTYSVTSAAKIARQQ
ncbi:hypothetical protein VP01_4052g1 [Puccinia sorghi]|uniref:Uncharacterized protein n=1 Tax=Puccinia sorghi TaxID=27349 RepID=A0A0L6URP6_9BASI|nr:hypothetical protein VP01_4052g1 [Puccinia sorghi]